VNLLLSLLARLLPPPARERYLEEWRADLAGAAEAGLPRRTVLVGAAALLMTIDRDAPAHSGEPRGMLPRRFARRGVSLGVAAAVVLVGSYVTGGGVVPEAGAASSAGLALLDVVGAALLWSSLVVAALAALHLVGAALTARTRLAQLTCAAMVAGPIVVAVGIHGPHLSALVPLAGAALFIAGAVCGLIVLGGSTPIALEHRTATRRQRIPVALGGVLLVTALAVVGAVDLLVWNPLAKVPGTDLQSIYFQMSLRDGFDIGVNVAWVVTWAAFWTAASILVLAAACGGRVSPLTPRRIAVVTLGLVGAAVFFRFFAGFGFGMSIADTFATNGGDGSFVSALLPHLGQLALAVAVLAVGWAPQAMVRPVGSPLPA
jgi:hypothetical protein